MAAWACHCAGDRNPRHGRYLDRDVGGSVGAKPSFSFVAQAVYDTCIAEFVRVDDRDDQPAGRRHQDSGCRRQSREPLVLGHQDSRPARRQLHLTYVDDDTASAADVTSDYSFVVLHPSVVPAKLGTRLAGVATPVLATHSQLLDEMAWIGCLRQRDADRNHHGHRPADARAVRGEVRHAVTINTTAQNIGWGTPTAAADEIAVEAGAAPSSRVSPERSCHPARARMPRLLQRRQHDEVQQQCVDPVRPGRRLHLDERGRTCCGPQG